MLKLPSPVGKWIPGQAQVRFGELLTPWQELGRSLIFAGPGVLWVMFFLVLPGLLLLVCSFLSRGEFGQIQLPLTLENYLRILGFGPLGWTPIYWQILGRSLLVAGVTTFFCVLLAYPLAFFIAAHPPRQRDLLLTLVVVPFWTNLVIRTYAWMVVLAPEGWPARLAAWLGWIPPQTALYPSWLAVYLGMVYTFLPYMVLPLYTAVERIDWRLAEAARDLYAKGWQVFWWVLLPQTLPGLAAGLILVGIPVLSDLLTWPRGHRPSLHTRITLGVVVVLLCTGGIGLFLGESLPGGSLLEVSWPHRLGLTFFQSVSARTAGFAAIPIEDLTPASQLLLMALMFIGAAPASMGGGMTTGTLAVLVLALWGYARGLPSAQIAGRSLDPSMVRKAAAVLTVSLFVVLLAAWLILLTHSNSRLDPVLFEVISAFATCGLSTGFTGELNWFGQLIIVLVMFWGRLGALTIVLALAQQQPRPLVTYPEESILIG